MYSRPNLNPTKFIEYRFVQGRLNFFKKSFIANNSNLAKKPNFETTFFFVEMTLSTNANVSGLGKNFTRKLVRDDKLFLRFALNLKYITSS